MSHTAACYQRVRTSQVAPVADAASAPPVSRRAPAIVTDLAGGGLAPSRISAGAPFPGAAVALGTPAARPSQISVGTVGKNDGELPQYSSPVLDVVGKGGGRPLDPKTRAVMEAMLGSDFSEVRVHTSDTAVKSAAAISAKAYTVGHEVVFGPGSFDPASHEGRRRLAHELVHVQQQRQGPVSGTENGGGVMISDPADSFEREAEVTAARVVTSAQPVVGRGLRGARQGRRRAGAGTGFVQRQAADGTLQVPEVQIFGSPPGYQSRVGQPFASMDGAAIPALEEIDQVSLGSDTEFAGNIYQQGGSFSFSKPVPGTNIESDPRRSPVPTGATIVATYHSHAGGFNPTDEFFSPTDELKASFGKKPSYLITPTGHLYKYLSVDLLPPAQQTQNPNGAVIPLQP